MRTERARAVPDTSYESRTVGTVGPLSTAVSMDLDMHGHIIAFPSGCVKLLRPDGTQSVAIIFGSMLTKEWPRRPDRSIPRNTDRLHGLRTHARPPPRSEDGGDQGPGRERGRSMAPPQPGARRRLGPRIDLSSRRRQDGQGPAGARGKGPRHADDSGRGRGVPG